MKKNFWRIIILIVLLAGVGVGVYLVRHQQEIRKTAAPATSIYLDPTDAETETNQTISLNIKVDTGINFLSTVFLELSYDPIYLEPVSLNYNDSALPQVLRTTNFSQTGLVSGSAGMGSPAAGGKPISGSGITIATITFKTKAKTLTDTVIHLTNNTAAYTGTKEEDPGSNLITQKGSARIITGSRAIISTPTPAPTEALPTSSPNITPTPTTSTPIPTVTSGILQPTPTSIPTPRPTITSSPVSTLTQAPTTLPTPTTSAPTATSTTTVQLTNVAAGETLTDNTPTFSGIAAPGAKIVITVESEVVTATVYADNSGHWSWTPSTSLENGNHKITVVATNNQGQSNSSAVNFAVAEELPITGQGTISLVLLIAGLLLLGIAFRGKGFFFLNNFPFK